MGKIVKNYDSFRNAEPVNEELLGALYNFLKNMFKKATEKIKAIANDYQEFKKYRKDVLLNPKAADGFFSGVFKEYNAKPQFNDQDCFDIVSKMVDPDDSIMSQKSIGELVAGLKEQDDKQITQWAFETIRNKTLVYLQYGGNVAKGFAALKPLPTPAIKPELKSGKAVQRTADGKGFVDQTHLPALKKIIAGLTDDKKKAAVLNWINSTVLPEMLKYSDELTEEMFNQATGKKGGTQEDILKSYGAAKPEDLVDKEVYYKRDGYDEATDKKEKLGKNKVIAYDQAKGLTIQGEKETFVKGLDKLISKEEGDKLTGAQPGAEGEAMDYKKLNDIFDKQGEVIYLLPGVEKDKYDPKKAPAEQEEVVGVAKMKALNDQNTEESVTIDDKDGKEIKMGYDKVIGPNAAAQGDEEKEAEKALGEIKDEPEKMKKVATYADFLKRGKDDSIKTISDMIDDELKEL